MEIAADGFDALQAFFTEHPQFQQRPLFITGAMPALGPSAAAVAPESMWLERWRDKLF